MHGITNRGKYCMRQTTLNNTNYQMNTYFTRNLKECLSVLIKGSVTTYLCDDKLIVTLTAYNNIEYTYTLDNLSASIVHGLSSQALAKSIYKWYKAFIFNLYF